MKVAIIHDYIKEYGGAERVLEALHEIWSEATVFTSVYLPEYLGPHRQRFSNWKIVTSVFQNVPFIAKLISPLRLFSPWIFENFNFSEYDLIIVSATGAYFPNLIVRKTKTSHITYCHTPPRYLYGYPTARNWKKHWWGRMLGNWFNKGLREYDFLSYQRPDYIIANSEEIKSRIKKFYRRDSTVIYPPVNISSNFKDQRSKPQLKAKSYFLAGGRLARAKRIDLAIEVCNRLKQPLKVYGRGFADYDSELKKMAGPTVEFLGEVSDSELNKLYLGAKALIYPSEQEDFGIIPVEAQGCGLPVIALNQGGVKETVIDGKTGVLFPESTVESLIKAIKSLDKLRINKEDCIENAKRFSKERFKKEIKQFIDIKMQKSKSKITM